MFIEQAQETEPPQPGRGHGRVHVARAGVPPRPPAVGGGRPRAGHVEAPPAEFADAGPWAFPLPPDNAAQLTTQPLIDVLETRLDFCQPEIRHPASEDEAEVLHGVGEASTPPLAQQPPQGRLQPLDGCGRHAEACGTVPRHAVAEKLPRPRPCDAALVPIHLQPEPLPGASVPAMPARARPPPWTAHTRCSRRRTGRSDARAVPAPGPTRRAECC